MICCSLALYVTLIAKVLLTCLPWQDVSPPKSLSAAAAKMQTYLEAMPEPNQSDWKYFFHWDSWGPQLAKEQLPDRKSLEVVHARFYGVYEGLEQTAFLQMRSELRQFLNGTQTQESTASQPALVIRLNPNQITNYLNSFSRAKNETRQTGNWIAGAWVTGTAQCQTNVSAELVPFGESAAIAVRVNGTITSPHNIAHKGAFQVHGSSTSQLSGLSYLYLDKEIVRATEPVFSAQTQSTFSHVDGPRLLSGVAMRQAHKNRGQGESEGSSIIAAKATEELKTELEQELKQTNAPLAEQGQYHILLQRANLLPSLVTTNLTSNALQLGVRFPQSGADKVLTSRAMTPETAFEVGIHESLATPFAGNFLRGSAWSDIDFALVQKELTGTSSNEMLIGATPERWNVRWDWAEPLKAKITNDFIEYEFSFSEAQIDNRPVRSGLKVKSRYLPHSARWGIEFRRVGEVEISSLRSDEKLSAEDAALFHKKFSSLLGETIFLDGLSPPAGGSWDLLAIYEISGVRLEKGWMVMSARRADQQLAKQ